MALRGLEDGNWSYFGDAETAADGTYSMDGLRPGHELPRLVRVAG